MLESCSKVTGKRSGRLTDLGNIGSDVEAIQVFSSEERSEQGDKALNLSVNLCSNLHLCVHASDTKLIIRVFISTAMSISRNQKLHCDTVHADYSTFSQYWTQHLVAL